MSDVVAKLYEGNGSLWDDERQPGEFKYFTIYGQGPAEAGLQFVCPCGCKEIGHLQFAGLQTTEPDRPKWAWNGNREKPTLTPSILRKGGCNWHGYLTDGVFRSC